MNGKYAAKGFVIALAVLFIFASVVIIEIFVETRLILKMNRLTSLNATRLTGEANSLKNYLNQNAAAIPVLEPGKDVNLYLGIYDAQGNVRWRVTKYAEPDNTADIFISLHSATVSGFVFTYRRSVP